eukprot:Skav207428  [mRNA]  locus=scaffold1798:18030:38291:+ [translate_table: standard]
MEISVEPQQWHQFVGLTEALAACCVEGRDAVEGIHGLHCAFTEDHVDWPRLLGALYELSTNGSHTAVMISSAQLQLHMDSDKERDLSSDGCFIGLFTLRLVVGSPSQDRATGDGMMGPNLFKVPGNLAQ